jgi:plastocyanin
VIKYIKNNNIIKNIKHMNKPTLIAIVIVIVVIAAGGYYLYAGNKGPAYNTTPSTTNTVNNTSATPPVVSNQPENLANSVSIKNFAFNPSPLTVKAGATVTWTNNDSAAHQIRSNIFNSVVLSPGDTFQFTFYNAGEYDYSCSIHPAMLGKIIVTEYKN